MDNNLLFRQLRFALNYNDAKMVQVFALADLKVNKVQVNNWLRKEDEEFYESFHDKKFATFLNGLITEKRGKKDGEQPTPEKTLTNNLILRKLKIAFNLKVEDIVDILQLADLKVSKHEISAFFRKPLQNQYRNCGDQILRNFVYGLRLKLRPEIALDKS